jgi:hypothetical protein
MTFKYIQLRCDEESACTKLIVIHNLPSMHSYIIAVSPWAFKNLVMYNYYVTKVGAPRRLTGVGCWMAWSVLRRN